MPGSSGGIDVPRASSARRRTLLVFAALAVLVLAVDQLTKAWAIAALSPGHPLPALGNAVRLSLVQNRGAAFGIAAFGGGVLVAVGILFCVVIPIVLLRQRRWSTFHAVLLALIWGGSAGNLVDRLRLGAVTDFIDLRVWPVFNGADIAITVGFVLLALRLLRGPARAV